MFYSQEDDVLHHANFPNPPCTLINYAVYIEHVSLSHLLRVSLLAANVYNA